MVMSMSNNMISEHLASIGDRIECSGQFGTVKYIGPVKGYHENWLGIDWDDPTRGKHNGIVNDVQYFEASYPTSGSFVRLEKVQFGQSAISAITSRYGRRDDNVTAKINQQQLLSVQQTINAPFLKLVGFDQITDKQSDFNNLQVVTLRLQNVNSVGAPTELQRLCPNITELDISKNLINNWSLVFSICSELQNLQWLNVGQNFLKIPENYDSYRFPNLLVLICGAMGLTWSDVLKLSSVFCNVEELRVPCNKINSLCTPDSNNFTNLKLLDLEDNDLNDWNEVHKLKVITTLEQLNLENTSLKAIKFEKSKNQMLDVFPNLKKLIISQNSIDDWESIGELNKLQNLEDLKCLKNPILEKENYATCIQLIVARIASLKVFNGAVIKPDERRGAEYDYLKKYGLEWLSVKDNEKKHEEFLASHNRYIELLEQYGTPEESELTVQSKLIQVSLIEVDIVYNDKVMKKRLPPSISIQKLIMLVQRMFNLSERPTLLYVSGTQPGIEIELNDEGKEFGFYSVQNGDQIIAKC